MNNIEKKRMWHSMAISTAIHFAVLLLIASITFSVYAISSSCKESIVVKYSPPELITYHVKLEDVVDKKMPALPSDKLSAVNKTEDFEQITHVVQKQEPIIVLNEKPREKKIDNVKVKKDEYKINTNASLSSIKRVEANTSFDDIDVNSEKFGKYFAKMFWDYKGKSLRDLEEIKNYYHEIHILISQSSDATGGIIINSYTNRVYSVSSKITSSDVNHYPLKVSKNINLNRSDELLSFSQEVVSEAGFDITDYDKIYVLAPNEYWIEQFNCANKFLSKYNLSLESEDVKVVCIRYVKDGTGFRIEVDCAIIIQNGKSIRIDN